MLFSYAWPVKSENLTPGSYHRRTHPRVGMYVRPLPRTPCVGGAGVWFKNLPKKDIRASREGLVKGRVVIEYPKQTDLLGVPVIAVDAAASRWTGASVAGLVVGAMGVLVFALYLRHWLKVSRLLTEGAPPAQEESTA